MSKELETHILDVFRQLGKYNDQIVSIDVYLESLNKSGPKDKQVKAKVLIPGHELYADSEEEDFVSAAQRTYDKAKRKLSDFKEIDKENYRPRPEKP